ncbi:glycine-rich protein DOT1-like [Trachypithecus francoisi]|uniref:glycine-rich protein DOT1-like n=1 Tax=Trachypithecus francoisi TaxID=54180 RepID=UPI00141ABDC3|nr:glycine-rich protein DOT1-like [Trachypithecus francoisi]
MICGLEGRETGEGAAAGAGGGTGTCTGRSGKLRGARGDGCPVRGPSGSAAAEPLGLTAGPEPQRSGGGGGLTILPRGPVPSNRHRPRCGSAGGSSLTFLAGGASASCPGPGGGGGDDVGRGGREGGRLDLQRQQEKGTGEGGGAAGAGATAARATFRYPRWVPVNAPFSLLLSISPGG